MNAEHLIASLVAGGIDVETARMLVAGILALFGQIGDEQAWKEAEKWHACQAYFDKKVQLERVIVEEMLNGRKPVLSMFRDLADRVRIYYIFRQLGAGVKDVDWMGWRPCFRWPERWTRRLGFKVYNRITIPNIIHFVSKNGYVLSPSCMYPNLQVDNIIQNVATELELMMQSAAVFDDWVVIFNLAWMFWVDSPRANALLLKIAQTAYKGMEPELPKWDAKWDNGNLQECYQAVMKEMEQPMRSLDGRVTNLPSMVFYGWHCPLGVGQNKLPPDWHKN